MMNSDNHISKKEMPDWLMKSFVHTVNIAYLGLIVYETI